MGDGVVDGVDLWRFIWNVFVGGWGKWGVWGKEI